MRLSQLTEEQLANYDRDGFLLIKAKDVWTPAELKLIQASVDEMAKWPDAPGKYMKVSRALHSTARPPARKHATASRNRHGSLQVHWDIEGDD